MKRFFTIFALLAVSACLGVMCFASSVVAAVDRSVDFASTCCRTCSARRPPS